MNRARWSHLFSIPVVFALSVACLTLFPASPEATPTKHRDQRGPLKFEPQELPKAQLGVPYEAEIQVTQNVTPVGDFMVDPQSLPPGLALIVATDAKDTARITGIPAKRGTYTFRVDVWCYGTMVNGQTGSHEYTIVVE